MGLHNKGLKIKQPQEPQFCYESFEFSERLNRVIFWENEHDLLIQDSKDYIGISLARVATMDPNVVTKTFPYLSTTSLEDINRDPFGGSKLKCL